MKSRPVEENMHIIMIPCVADNLNIHWDGLIYMGVYSSLQLVTKNHQVNKSKKTTQKGHEVLLQNKMLTSQM